MKMLPSLDNVKKAIGALTIMSPNGILLDKLNREFEETEGYPIPYGSFGYSSLLSFLEDALKDRVRIYDVGFGGFQIRPIPNENNKHIYDLTCNKADRRQNQHARNDWNRPSYGNAQRSTQNSQPSTSKARSPTMPRLKPYRPFSNSAQITGQTSRATEEQILAKNRLLESQKALMKRTRKSTSHSNNLTPSRSSNVVPKHSIHRGINQRMEQLSLRNAPESSHLTAAKPTSSGTCYPKSSAPNAFARSMSSRSPASGDFKSVWDDELESIQPPTKSKSNGSSQYAVSDTSLETPSNSTRVYLEPSSEEEEEETTKLKDLIEDLNVGDVVEVDVCEVNNPYKFWIHIRNEKNIKEADQLSQDLQDFYSANKDSGELKVRDVGEPGADYFAACYEGCWHRVAVNEQPMGESVLVSFIDCGSRATINISSMRRLVKQFWSVPKAAVCCALGNIKPIENITFSTDGVYKFIELVDGEELYARIINIESQKSKAIVELILKSNKLCVNEELIKLGHAVRKTVRANA